MIKTRFTAVLYAFIAKFYGFGTRFTFVYLEDLLFCQEVAL